MAETWTDADGLYHKYGTTKSVVSVGGEYSNVGALREIDVRLDLTTLGTASAIISDTIFFPKERIVEVRVETLTAATGSGAVLNLGLISTDRTTAIDADGLIAALPLASMDTAGEVTTLNVGSTYAGALLGTSTTSVGHLCADYDTAAFTAGVVAIRIRFMAP